MPSSPSSSRSSSPAGGSGTSRSRARRQRARANPPAQKPARQNLFDQVGTTAAEPAPFDQLGLPDPLLRSLAEHGLTEAFPIQAATIPDALAGRDVLGRAQTGSGKTLAFGLPMLAMQDGPAQPLHPRGLVLVPTRELATQVTESLKTSAKSLGRYVREVVGGASFDRQAATLRRGVDVLVATPGRLNDHVRQGTCALSEVERVALDEADQMADMGFLPQVRQLLNLVPEGGQRMLFSATLDGDVDKLVREYMSEPSVHSLAPATASVDTMEHHQLLVSAQEKQAVLARIASREGRTIVFVRTKHHADRVAKKLRNAGASANALHGGKAQNARSRILDEFREAANGTLVATNVAARGIHVDGVSLVVHVEPPADPKDYLHRAGRTARAGESGTVVTLVTPDQQNAFRTMVRSAGVTVETCEVSPESPELVQLTGAREPSGVPAPEMRTGGGGPAARSGGGQQRSSGQRRGDGRGQQGRGGSGSSDRTGGAAARSGGSGQRRSGGRGEGGRGEQGRGGGSGGARKRGQRGQRGGRRAPAGPRS